MLNLNILTDDGEAVQVLCAGRLSQQSLSAEVDPLERLLGPTVFARRVLLNLEHVEFLDSSGLGWLIQCHQRFGKNGGVLSLCKLPPRILQMLQFCSMDRYLHLIREEAGDAARPRSEAP